MCTYGIGLPFGHPIWQSLPPCNCGAEMMSFPSVWAPDLNAGPWHVVGGDREFIFEGDDEPDPMSLIYDPSDAPVATP